MPRISMYYTSTFDAIKDLVKKCSLGVEVLQVGEADGVVTNVFDIQKFGPEVQTPRALMCQWCVFGEVSITYRIGNVVMHMGIGMLNSLPVLVGMPVLGSRVKSTTLLASRLATSKKRASEVRAKPRGCPPPAGMLVMSFNLPALSKLLMAMLSTPRLDV